MPEFETSGKPYRFRMPSMCAACGAPANPSTFSGFIIGNSDAPSYVTETVRLPCCRDCESKFHGMVVKVGKIKRGCYVFHDERFAYEFARLNDLKIITEADKEQILKDAY